MPWLESKEEDSDYGEDYFKMEGDYLSPQKRRQRRQRLHSLHCYVARTGVVAVVASASMLTRQVENMTRQEGISLLKEDAHGHDGILATLFAIIANFKSSLGCAIGGTAARLGEVATGLANAIGEPPQRLLAGREEQDAPLLLFWAINLCALCTIASLVLFVIAFFGNPSDTSPEPEAVDHIPLASTNPLLDANSTEPDATERKKLEGLFRVLGVVSLSLVSGCGLGLRHPIQSALLSGF